MLLYNKKNKRKRKLDNTLAEVISAIPLAQNEEEVVRRWVTQTIGREIAIKKTVDIRVIAGIRVRAGDWIFDGTFAHQLDRAKQLFTQ